jgi:tetratricopeptide (TPR) repeat protein
MIKNIFLSCFVTILIFSCFANKSNTVEGQRSVNQENEQFFLVEPIYEINIKELENNFWVNSWKESDIEYSREHFLNGKKQYELKNYNYSIQYFSASLAKYSTEICFYYYGLALFDMFDYENAVNAFYKTIQGFQEKNYMQLLNNMGLFHDGNIYNNYIFKQDYSYDENNNCREYYFSFYNIACAFALLGNIEKSVEYIIKAIEHGYPYLDYIYNDPDLTTVFNSPNGNEIKNTIIEIYNKGFDYSIMSGKGSYELGRTEYEFIYYHFNDNNLLSFERGVGATEREYYSGSYYLKNYTIFISLDKQLTGMEWLDLPIRFTIQIENIKKILK